MRKGRTTLLGILSGALLSVMPARAQEIADQLGSVTPSFTADQPIAIEAQEMGYDQSRRIVIARGKVVVAQGENVLHADQLTYFFDNDIVEARGNVSVLQPSGDVFFADYVQLSSNMKRGVINHFRARLSDNSVFAAAEAKKETASTTDLTRAVYSPCKLCPDSNPFWQMKSNKVTVDEVEKTVTYRNARLEMFGVPVFYTPYFVHPTPDAPAQSGFLTPQYAHDDNLGTIIETPYYWRIGHSAEAIVTPWYLSDEGLLLETDYRQLTDGGSYRLRGSFTDAKNRDVDGNEISGREVRGHIYANGVESITDYSRVGFNLARSTDDTYLRRYGFGDQRVLFSDAYVEAAQDRNYGVVRALAIQGLRETDDPDRTPLVLPSIEGFYETDPLSSGIRFNFFGNAQSLTRQEGADQQRLILAVGAQLPLVTQGGHVITTALNLRQDIYNVTDVLQPDSSLFDGSKLRTIPQASVEWRYPLIREFEQDSLTVEPIILAVMQPNIGNPTEISNEDNTLIELNDTNLFSLNRMPGYDTVDSGSRVAFGARGQYLFAGGESLEALLGQTYNADSDTPFPNSVTPGESFSDYIGSVSLSAAPIDLSYRFALNNDDLSPNRNEVVLGFVRPWLSFSGAFRQLNNNQFLPDSREAIVNTSLPLTDEWSLFGAARRDVELDQTIAAASGLLYRNECFNMVLQVRRNYTRDRDIEPSTNFTFRIGFKNLGEFGE